jgi:hypothetical protein
MVEAKCPKCACKLELGRAFVPKNPSKCWGTPENVVLEVVLKCPVCGFSTERSEDDADV